MSSHSNKQRPTMQDVADLADVGIKTVSRVVNHEPKVSEETARRVWEAVNELDYHVDMRAGSLRRSSGETLSIALLVSSVDNPFAGELHRGVEEVARSRKTAVLASSLNEDPQRELDAIDDAMRRHVDGIILGTTTTDCPHIDRILSRGTAVVLVDRSPAGVEADAVTSDTQAAAKRATEHLVKHGHKRIALLLERPGAQTALDRRSGYEQALSAAGIPLDHNLVVDGLANADAAEQALNRLLDSPNAPTAVFSAQNLITIGAVRALRKRGLQNQVALVGFDDVPLSDVLDPGITVIKQDPVRIGQLAAERIFQRIDGEKLPPEHIVVPTELIERGSGEIPAP